MDAKALYAVKHKEYFREDCLNTVDKFYAESVIFAACIIAETIGNRMDELIREVRALKEE